MAVDNSLRDDRTRDDAQQLSVVTDAATPGGSGARLAEPGEPMTDGARRLLGVWLLGFGVVVLGHLLWAWSLAAQLLASGPQANVQAHWMGLGFSPSTQFGLLLVVLVTALAGSLAVVVTVFANRAGHRTLEQHWAWWYVLRPCSAGAVGVLFYAVVVAGLLGSPAPDHAGLALAGAVGGLAGLFTDRVLAMMRSVLGASAFNVSASLPEQAAATGGTAEAGTRVGATG